MAAAADFLLSEIALGTASGQVAKIALEACPFRFSYGLSSLHLFLVHVRALWSRITAVFGSLCLFSFVVRARFAAAPAHFGRLRAGPAAPQWLCLSATS